HVFPWWRTPASRTSQGITSGVHHEPATLPLGGRKPRAAEPLANRRPDRPRGPLALADRSRGGRAGAPLAPVDAHRGEARLGTRVLAHRRGAGAARNGA